MWQPQDLGRANFYIYIYLSRLNNIGYLLVVRGEGDLPEVNDAVKVPGHDSVASKCDAAAE